MENTVELIRLFTNLSPEQLIFMVAIAAIGVAALAIHSVTSILKNKDH